MLYFFFLRPLPIQNLANSHLVWTKGNQPWTFIGRTNAKAPILWPPDAKKWFIGKDPDAGEDWGQEKKGAVEDEMVGWHYWLSGHEFEQTPGDSEGQGSLAFFRRECLLPQWEIVAFIPFLLILPLIVIQDLLLSLVPECLLGSGHTSKLNSLHFFPHPAEQESGITTSEQRVGYWNSDHLSLLWF